MRPRRPGRRPSRAASRPPQGDGIIMLRPDTFALTLLLASLTGLGPLSMDMYLPSLPDIGRALHASTAQVQLTISSLPDRLCRRPDRLRTDRGPLRTQARDPGRAGVVWRRKHRLRHDAIHRDAHRGTFRAGARRRRRDRAGAGRGARSVFRRARRPRTVADGIDPGVRADHSAGHRRRVADRVRLARELHLAGDLRGSGGRLHDASAPRDSAPARPRAVFARRDGRALSVGAGASRLSRAFGHRDHDLRRTLCLGFGSLGRDAGRLRTLAARVRRHLRGRLLWDTYWEQISRRAA